MHCASCEILIEKRILEEPDVKAVEASISNSTIRIEYDGRVPKLKDLNNWFKSDGYTFSETKQKEAKEYMIYFVEGKGFQLDRLVLKKRLKTLSKIALVFFVLYLFEKSGISKYANVNSNSSLFIFFVFGVIAGLSSCAALVGGILLSLSKKWNEQYGYRENTKTKMVPHLYFHSGRLIAYGIFGAILGSVGKAVAFDNVTIYASVIIVVSIVMFIIGLQMAGVKWAEKLQIRMPKFITRNIAGAQKQNTKQLPFIVGAGTVLLPCGFTLIAQGVALTSGSALKGALMLLLFVIGTMVPLLFISLASIKGTSNPKRGRAFSFYAGVILVIFALYNVNGQLNVLGAPSLSDIFTSSKGNQAQSPKLVVNEQGTQVVNLIAKGFDYSLTSPPTIKAGVPTKLVVDNQGVLGCGAFLATRGLIDGFVDLQKGENIIDLGNPKKGTYKITCSMGMVSPVTLRVE